MPRTLGKLDIHRWLCRSSDSRRSTVRCTNTSIITSCPGWRQVTAWCDWNDIVEISTWKLDVFVGDQVRIGFTLRGGEAFEFHEDMLGYRDVIAEVERRFPLPEDWKHNVIFPPFETNDAVLWKEDSSKPIFNLDKAAPNSSTL